MLNLCYNNIVIKIRALDANKASFRTLALLASFSFCLETRETQGGKIMAKISELPQATESKSTDVIPIVQDGRTKQIVRQLLMPSMEVLNDITLTEDVMDITRAVDDNGNPFKLKEFFLLFAGKCPSEANGVVRLRFNGGLIYSAYHRYTFPKNTDDTNRLLWFHSKKLFDGAYMSTYASQFIRDTDGNDTIVNGQIRCQGLTNSNCAPYSDLYFRFPAENTANFQTASSWQFGVTGDLKLLAGSRIIALGVRE